MSGAMAGRKRSYRGLVRIRSTSGCDPARGGARPPRRIIKATSPDDLPVEHVPWYRTAPDALPACTKHLGLARDHPLGRRRSASARARAHRGLLAVADGRAFDHGRRAAHLRRAWAVVDAAPSRGLRGGDLLRALRDRRLVPGRGWRRAGPLRRHGRLPRPPRARACAHAHGGRGRPRRARLRAAALRRQHPAAAGRCVVARPDLGHRGRRGGSPLGERGSRRTTDVERARRATGTDRQRRETSQRSSAGAARARSGASSAGSAMSPGRNAPACPISSSSRGS